MPIGFSVPLNQITPDKQAELLAMYDGLTRVVVLNGPPGCGKDHFCHAIEEGADVAILRFSLPLKYIVGQSAGLTLDQMTTQQDKVIIKGKSLREHQIELFSWMAERFGEDVLGRLLIGDIRTQMHAYLSQGVVPVFVTPDGGRGPEVQYVADQLGLDNVLIVRIHRDGYDFENDIRNYIDLEGVEAIDIENKGDETYVPTMRQAINDWITAWYERKQAALEQLGFSTLVDPA